MRNIGSLSLFFTLVLFSCGKDLPKLEGIDIERWKIDKNGCKSSRMEMVNDLIAQKQKLLALNEGQIIALLGKPDRNELYKRNQKFYYYFLQPSDECIQRSASAPSKLSIRFNAMGLAKDIQMEK